MTKVLVLALGAFCILAPLWSSMAMAGTFCNVTSFGKQCWFYDMDSCQQEAASSGGACIINQKEARPPSGSAPFCVVTSHSSSCWYYNAQDCQREAAISGGACAVNPNR